MAHSQPLQEGGKVARKSAIAINLKMSGNVRDLQDEAGFRRSLTALLRRACYAGSFEVYVTLKVRGSGKLKGLEVRSALDRGVELYWQPGDNGSRIQVILFVPHRGNAQIISTWYNDLVAATTADDPDTDAPAPKLPEKRVLPVVDVVPESLPANMSTQSKPNGKDASYVEDGYTHKLTSVAAALLVEELLIHANDDGYVEKRICSNLLVEVFSFNRLGLGPVYRALEAGGYLDELASPDKVRIGKRHRKKPDKVIPPASTSTVRALNGATNGAGAPVLTIERLEVAARKYTRVVAALADIDEELPLLQDAVTQLEAARTLISIIPALGKITALQRIRLNRLIERKAALQKRMDSAEFRAVRALLVESGATQH